MSVAVLDLDGVVSPLPRPTSEGARARASMAAAGFGRSREHSGAIPIRSRQAARRSFGALVHEVPRQYLCRLVEIVRSDTFSGTSWQMPAALEGELTAEGPPRRGERGTPAGHSQPRRTVRVGRLLVVIPMESFGDHPFELARSSCRHRGEHRFECAMASRSPNTILTARGSRPDDARAEQAPGQERRISSATHATKRSLDD